MKTFAFIFFLISFGIFSNELQAQNSNRGLTSADSSNIKQQRKIQIDYFKAEVKRCETDNGKNCLQRSRECLVRVEKCYNIKKLNDIYSDYKEGGNGSKFENISNEWNY